MDTPRQRTRKPRTLLRNVLLGLVALPVLSLLILWWRVTSDVPSVTIPTPSLPNPNAFDYYVAAGHELVQTKKIDEIAEPPVQIPLNLMIMNPIPPPIPMTLQQKQAVIEANAAVLQILHQGFAYECWNHSSRSIEASLPSISHFRTIARLLAAQCSVRAEEGNWGGAAESGLNALRFGEDITHGSVLIGALVGVACSAIGRKPLWDIVAHLNAPDARSAVQRLETIMANPFSCADTLQEEKYFGQAALMEKFRTVNVSNALSHARDNIGPDEPVHQQFAIAMALLYSKKRVLQNYTNYMDQLSACTRQPYAARVSPPPIPTDPINALVADVFGNVNFTVVKHEALNGLLLVTFALHAFRLEHGRYPSSLTGLAPAYLHKLPDDPFALTGTFQYHPDGQKYVLYSVGSDGKDDGGTPIDDPQQATVTNPNGRYRIGLMSKGDIIAGLNY